MMLFYVRIGDTLHFPIKGENPPDAAAKAVKFLTDQGLRIRANEPIFLDTVELPEPRKGRWQFTPKNFVPKE